MWFTYAILLSEPQQSGLSVENIGLPYDPQVIATYYSNRSAAFVNNGNYREALADAERAIALHPNWSRARLVIALLQ